MCAHTGYCAIVSQIHQIDEAGECPLFEGRDGIGTEVSVVGNAGLRVMLSAPCAVTVLPLL